VSRQTLAGNTSLSIPVGNGSWHVRGRPRYRPAYAARLPACGPEAQFAGLMAANGQERADYRSLT